MGDDCVSPSTNFRVMPSLMARVPPACAPRSDGLLPDAARPLASVRTPMVMVRPPLEPPEVDLDELPQAATAVTKAAPAANSFVLLNTLLLPRVCIFAILSETARTQDGARVPGHGRSVG